MINVSAKARKIKEEDLEMIMNWRMSPEVTKYMTTDPKLTLDGQKKWLRKINENRDEFYYVLEVDDTPVVIVFFVEWDKNADIIHTGVYIAVKEKRSIKLTADLQMSLYDFAFETLKVNKVAFEILGNNPMVIKFNERLGAKREGILRQAIKKGNEYYDLYLLSVLKEEWPYVKEKTKYDKIVFPLCVDEV